MSYMKKFFLLVFVTSTLIVACDSEPTGKVSDPITDEIEIVTPDFKGDKFEDPVHLELLKELDICEDIEQDSASYYAACSPVNFDIKPISTKKAVKDAFLLQTRSEIRLKGQDISLPVRHLLIFERENGALVRVNGFRGELISMEEGKDGRKELMVALYLKEDDTLFSCVFKWKDGKYEFDSVFALDWGEGMKPLKADKKAETSAQIYTSLMANNLIF